MPAATKRRKLNRSCGDLEVRLREVRSWSLARVVHSQSHQQAPRSRAASYETLFRPMTTTVPVAVGQPGTLRMIKDVIRPPTAFTQRG